MRQLRLKFMDEYRLVEQEGKHVVVKQKDRKFYSYAMGHYIYLDEIREIVLRGEDLQVIDRKSKKDCTKETLISLLAKTLLTSRITPTELKTLVKKYGKQNV